MHTFAPLRPLVTEATISLPTMQGHDGFLRLPAIGSPAAERQGLSSIPRQRRSSLRVRSKRTTSSSLRAGTHHGHYQPRSFSVAAPAPEPEAWEGQLRSSSCEPMQTTMMWTPELPDTTLAAIDIRKERRDTVMNHTRKFPAHKRRSIYGTNKVRLCPENLTLYDPEAPSRMVMGRIDWSPVGNVGYGAISQLNDEVSRARKPKEIRELIAKWGAMYKNSKFGHGSKQGTSGGAGGGGLGDLDQFEAHVGKMARERRANHAAGHAGAGDSAGSGAHAGVGDSAGSGAHVGKQGGWNKGEGLDGEGRKKGSRRRKERNMSLSESVSQAGFKGQPTPIIEPGKGNGHGHQRQKHYKSKQVLRPSEAERRMHNQARTVWGTHHTYLLLERALAAMQHGEVRSPRVQLPDHRVHGLPGVL